MIDMKNNMVEFLAQASACEHNFGHALLDPSFLPTEQLKKILREVLSLNAMDDANLRLRRLLARRMTFAGCQNITPDDIVAANGCKYASALSIRAVTKTGNVVAVETPAFPGLLQILEDLRLRAHWSKSMMHRLQPVGHTHFLGSSAFHRKARLDEDQLRQGICQQLGHLFGTEVSTPSKLLIKNWAYDTNTATDADKIPVHPHPHYEMPHSMKGL